MTGAASALEGLTPREREIAVTAASGAPAHELAASLFLSPRTVETHLIRIYRKLGLRSRAELVALVLGDRPAADPPSLVPADDAACSEPDIAAADEARCCPTCSTSLARDAKFCHRCGADASALTQDRRKVVTLLVCALARSAELGDSLDPEVFRAIIDEFHEACRCAVERHEGTIDRTLGDALLAVFGVPTAREDDALRAVRAAADIHAALVDLDARTQSRHGLPLTASVGVNTGEALIGTGRSGGALSAGETVNAAARLAQSAAPGETVIGSLTRELVNGAATVDELAPLEGGSAPDRRYRLLGMSRPTTAATISGFVGRRAETAALEQAFARVIDTETASLVTVAGDAGLGKSRLVVDFLGGVGATARVLSGRCLSYGEGITFWPVVELLRAACGLDGSERAEVVDARLGELVAGHDDAAALRAQLSALLVADGEPGSIGDVIRAVVSAVEHLAVREPVIVSVDDVHWAEPVLLDLLEALLHGCRDLPLLVVVQARPEFLAFRPTWGATTGNTVTLRLEPLRAADAEALVADVAELTDDEAAQVVAAAGGNPLFLEQLAAHAATRRDGSRLVVPPTLTALLTARLDQLDDGDRALMSDAAVIGQSFHLDELSALTGADLPGITARLDRLSERQIVRRDRSRGGYRFQHGLVQQAAYTAQPKAVRAQRHRAYATWLAEHPEVAAGELSALCGWHLEQAHALLAELSPAAADNHEVARRAADALSDAARAREAADPASAVSLLRRAAALTLDRRTRLRRLLRLAYLDLLFSVSANAAGATIAEADTEAVGVDAPAERALLEQLRLCHQLMTGTQATGGDNSHVAAAARRAAADADWLWGQAASARLYVLELQTADAWAAMRAPIDECIEAAAACGEQHIRNEALRFRASIVRWGPTPLDESIALLSQTLVALKDEPEERERVQMELGVLYALAGDIERAGAMLPAQPAIADTASYLHWAFTRAAIDEASGDDLAAATVMRAGADAMAATGDVGYSSTLYGWAAALFGLAGDLEAARNAAELARVSSPERDLVSQAQWRIALAVLAGHEGDTDAVDRLVAEAMPYVEAWGSLNAQGDLYRYAAAAFRLVGRHAESARMASQALEHYRRKGTTVYDRRCEALLNA